MPFNHQSDADWFSSPKRHLFFQYYFYYDGILKIMKGQNPNKGHRLDMISIPMIKLNLQTLRLYFSTMPTSSSIPWSLKKK